MNARERIAEAEYIADHAWLRPPSDATWTTATDFQRSSYLRRADAVLAVLPEILTDKEVMQAAVEMYDKSIRLAPSAAVRRILNAVTKKLTEQEASS